MMNEGDVIAGRFAIERLAGEGGMGVVYQALDRQSGRQVAIKVLHHGSKQHADRFERESELLAELRHPAIVRYIAHGHTPRGDQWLAMEWLEGEDLDTRLARGGVTLDETLTLARRVARALSITHARGVVHRDLKPSNLFLVGGLADEVRVLDYGVARREGSSLTRLGVMIGTVGYMAPEQARGEADVGPEADVFSLGCVIFQCITGRLPFPGDSTMAILAKILLEDAPRLASIRSDVPVELDELVAQMLDKDPHKRLRDGAAVSGALAAIRGTSFAHRRADDSRSPSPPTPVQPPAPSEPGHVVSTGERRLVSVLLLSAAQSVDADARAGIDGAARRHAARIEWLSDRAAVGLLSAVGDATDQAALAARLALTLQALGSVPRIVLSTGRAEVAGRLPVGEAIDRAVDVLRLLVERDTRASVIAVDEVTAGLLDSRFLLGGDAPVTELQGERPRRESTRTLLGRPSPFVGRDQELALLQSHLRACITNRTATAVLVTAPAGAGKSRLRHELLQHAVDTVPHVAMLIERGDPTRAGSPFGMLAPMLRRTAGIVEGEPLEARRQKLAQRVARSVRQDAARVTRFLGEMIGAPFDDEDSLRAARADATLMGDQVRRAWIDFVAAETTERPLLIVLEDLHWGDLPSITALDDMLRNLGDRPVMVLAFARPEVHAQFPGLWRDRQCREFELAPLSSVAARRLVEQTLGVASESATERIVSLAAGNPLYIEELMRAVVDGRGAAVPDTVLAMVQARVERLDHDLRRVLRAASIFGGVFWRGALAALLGTSGDRSLDDLLTELERLEVITPSAERRFPGEVEFSFAHLLVREAAYAMLTDRDRAAGHAAVGRWLRDAGETDGIVLGEHFRLGGEVAIAIDCFRRSAEQALDGGDLRTTLSLADRAVRCGASGAVLATLRRIESDAHISLGNLAQAESAAREAMALSVDGDVDWCHASGCLAQVLEMRGNRKALEELGKRLRLVSAAPDAERHFVIALSHAAWGLLVMGSTDHARATLDRARETRPETLGDAMVAAWLDRLRELLADIEGRLTRRLAFAASAVENFERAGDYRRACTARINLANVCMDFGAYPRAEKMLHECLATARRLGFPFAEAMAKLNLSIVLGATSRPNVAIEVAEAAATMFAVQGNPRLEGSAHANLARCLALTGAHSEARRAAHRALGILGQAPVSAFALAVLARIDLEESAAAAALSNAMDALKRVEGLGYVEVGDALVRLVHAEALQANGRQLEAQRAIEDARSFLMKRADEIDDAELRRTFLEEVPEHARTILLARRWVDEGRIVA